MNPKVAIVGNGWVGQGMLDLFPNALVYLRRDTIDATQPTYTNDKARINACDVAFICVPTPNAYTIKDVTASGKITADPNGEGALDTSSVEECIAWLETPLIVIRSTVNPGDTDRWTKKYMKNIVMQPEYLGETPAHPLLDTKRTPFIIVGGVPLGRQLLIEIYQSVYNATVRIRQMTAYEAEVVKLSENRAIAFKVAQCQELYDVCQKAGIDYNVIREAVYGDDPRFNLWFSFVFPTERGFNSKCIPKDVYAWCAWAESLGYDPMITRIMLEKNKQWINNA